MISFHHLEVRCVPQFSPVCCMRSWVEWNFWNNINAFSNNSLAERMRVMRIREPMVWRLWPRATSRRSSNNPTECNRIECIIDRFLVSILLIQDHHQTVELNVSFWNYMDEHMPLAGIAKHTFSDISLNLFRETNFSCWIRNIISLLLLLLIQTKWSWIFDMFIVYSSHFIFAPILIAWLLLFVRRIVPPLIGPGMLVVKKLTFLAISLLLSLATQSVQNERA